MDKVKVTLSLPTRIVNDIDEYACEVGKRRNEVIEEAIREYLIEMLVMEA